MRPDPGFVFFFSLSEKFLVGLNGPADVGGVKIGNSLKFPEKSCEIVDTFTIEKLNSPEQFDFNNFQHFSRINYPRTENTKRTPEKMQI